MTRDTASDAPDATQAWSVDDTVRDGLDRIAALELSDLMPSARENVPSPCRLPLVRRRAEIDRV